MLDADFPGFADSVARGRYALWLGSGISFDRIVGVAGVIGRVIEYLRSHRDAADTNCRYNRALEQILSELSEPVRACVHLDTPVDAWPPDDRKAVTFTLAKSYAQVLQTQLDGEMDEDFLLWTAVDVPGSFVNDDPDVEHLCIVMLALEGAIKEISSANWDYLVEVAEEQLTGLRGSAIDVCIRPADFQGADGRARLLKFHGCAARAIAEPAIYRPLLIARTPQIVGYRLNASYQVMRTRLLTLVQERRTLMIGLSAQDADIQDIFMQGANAGGWAWNGQPTPFIFAEDQLSTGQKTVLATAYGPSYLPNRAAIETGATVRAYGKALLLSLMLNVLQSKVAALCDLATPATWTLADKTWLKEGLTHLRDTAAAEADPDRLAFVRRLIAAMSSGLALYHGDEPHPTTRYRPISRGPLQEIPTEPSSTGMRQAAMAVAMIGQGARAGDWTVSPGATETIKLDQAGRETRLFFAANDDVAVRMIQSGIVDQDADDSVLLMSASPAARRQRSPTAAVGRTGKVGLREICVTSLIGAAGSANHLFEEFKRSAAL